MPSTVTNSAALPRLSADVGSDAILKALYSAGGVILEGLLSPDQVGAMNEEVDVPLAELNPGSTHESESIKAFHGSNTKRLTGLTTISKTFRDYLLDNDICHDIPREVNSVGK